MSATGNWKANLTSPMGSNEVLFDIVESDGVVTGTAFGEGELVELVEGVAEGNNVSWRLNITKPLKMSFVMKLEIDGDTWSGTAKAKIFPAAKVTGTRVS